ncbi:hypothetical protein CKA32_001304 [Geitlerinema sp. FC II]|nr:hypothetical protein CKA32_001304 [Geitlerinema sp. FC II]
MVFSRKYGDFYGFTPKILQKFTSRETEGDVVTSTLLTLSVGCFRGLYARSLLLFCVSRSHNS